ncbi:MAG: Holliday junction branch migration protein RuvA [Burkholderiaceae bacterium]|nr:Holliday junction branch migration protein RuvA [Burkholderiaceae bacterium]
MIGRLAGILLEKNPPEIVVDAAGVGYELNVPMSTFYDLPPAGDKVSLWTHLVVREDAHLLYGFLTHRERAVFRELVRISGIGPRTALAVLSGMTADELIETVALQETGRLTRVPGIGKKTAERLLLELKGRLAPELAGAGQGGRDATPAGTDVLRALLALGYSEKEAGAAVGRLPADSGVSEGIRQALKLLAKV